MGRGGGATGRGVHMTLGRRNDALSGAGGRARLTLFVWTLVYSYPGLSLLYLKQIKALGLGRMTALLSLWRF